MYFVLPDESHLSSTAPETAFAALHGQNFVLALRISSNL